MNSHFDCIGIRAPDDGSFNRLMDTILSQATDDAPRQKPFRHVRWTDPSGASVAIHLREGRDGPEPECVTPFFDPAGGLSQWRVRTHAPAPDPNCAHCGGTDCDILDEHGTMATRATVQLINFLPYKKWLGKEREFHLEIAAFAHRAAFYDSLAGFEEGQRSLWMKPDGTETTMPDGKPFRFGSNFFAPEGMFSPSDAPLVERAIVVFAGRVDVAQRLRNVLTGVEFRHLRISTYPGSLDVVLDPTGTEGEPGAGKIGLIRAWLVGRPIVPAPTAGKGWRRVLRLN